MMQKISVMIFVLMLSGLLQAQDAENVEYITDLIDRWQGGSDIAIVGNYAYITCGTSGLRIMDISDPEHPMPASCYSEDLGQMKTIDISGSYAFVGTENRVIVFDISEPLEPEIVDLHQLDYTIESIKLMNNGLYIGSVIGHENDSSTNYIEIFDISNQPDPELLCQFEWESENHPNGSTLRDIYPVDSGIFAVSSDELFFLELVEADSLRLAVTDNRFKGEYVSVVGNIAYLMDGAILKILDVSNPEELELIGECMTPSGCGTYINDIAVKEDIVYISSVITFCGSPGRDATFYIFSTVNVSDLREPQVIKSTELPLAANSISMFNEDIVVAQRGGIRIFDLSEPDTLQSIGFYNTNGYSRYIHLSGELLYVLDNMETGPDYPGRFDVLWMFDLSNMEDPVCVNYFELNAYEALVSDEFLYAFGNDSIRVFDLTEPQTPSYVDSYLKPGRYGGIHIDAPYIIMEQFEFLNTYEMTDADTLDLVGQFSVEDWSLRSMIVSEDVIYATKRENGIGIIDASDPTQMELITDYHLSGDTKDIQVSGNYAYVSNSPSGLVIIDISDPATPDSLGSIEVDGLRIHHFDNTYGYVQNDTMLVMIDVSDPENLVQAGYFDLELGRYEHINYVQTIEDFVYIALDENIGVFRNTLLNVDDRDNNIGIASEFRLSPAYPNPFNSTTTIEYALPFAAEVTLNLYNLSGQRVETLVSGRLQAGVHRTMLDAGDLASGLYFIKLDGVRQSVTQKIMLVK
ncbi:MAG: T9SS type A sorting domain-containing protein [Calditrichaeota bacterium]|nr:T9SS type A sorting domain-containing protein [Calditrichota bacterium]